MTRLRKTEKKSSSKTERVRKLVECSPHRTVGGGFFDGLMTEDVEHESHNERNAVATLPLCHDVSEISSQKTKEPYQDGDKVRHHVPDYTIKCSDHELKLEVKSLTSLLRDESLSKYQLIAKGYVDRQQRFSFLTDVQMEEEPRFSSVRILSRYVTSEIPDQMLTRASEALSAGPMTIPDLKKIAAIALVDVYTLLARRHITFNWGEKLTPEVRVSLPNQPYEGLKLEHILHSTRYGHLLEELALGRRPTDKCLLADAASWRQYDRATGPFNFAGGFSESEPLRDLGAEERIPRASGRRRNHAPGVGTLPSTQSK